MERRWCSRALFIAICCGLTVVFGYSNGRPRHTSDTWVTFRDSQDCAGAEAPEVSAAIAKARVALDQTKALRLAETMLADCEVRLGLLSFNVRGGFDGKHFDVRPGTAVVDTQSLGVVYIGMTRRRIRVVGNFLPRPALPSHGNFLLVEPDSSSVWCVEMPLDAAEGPLGGPARLLKSLEAGPRGLHLGSESFDGTAILCLQFSAQSGSGTIVAVNPGVTHLLGDEAGTSADRPFLAVSELCSIVWQHVLRCYAGSK